MRCIKISHNSKLFSTLVIIGLCLYGSLSYAKSYYVDLPSGWKWYREENALSQQTNRIVPRGHPDPSVAMALIRTRLTRALDQAIINPTEENVTHYIRLQQKISRKANRFSEVWQQVLLQQPELNYSLEVPTNNIARQVYFTEQERKTEHAIAQLTKDAGLFFFYRSDCPYCHRFAPILKEFIDHYGISLVAISVDGGVLAEFPDSKNDQGQAAQFGVSFYPALFLVNPTKAQVTPVAYGLVSQEDLKARLLAISLQDQGGFDET